MIDKTEIFFYFSYDYIKSAKKTEWGVTEWYLPKMQKSLGSIPSRGRKGKRQGGRKGGRDGGGWIQIQDA